MPEPFDVLTSRTVVLPQENIDTDQIIPARFLTTTSREGLGKLAFNDWRYGPDGKPREDFALNTLDPAGRRILVAGKNFGCGSSREHAPWALYDWGFRAVISTEIADIFTSNCLKNGLLPVVVDEETHKRLLRRPGESVTVDLEACEVRYGAHVCAFRVEPFARRCLMDGVDTLGWLMGRLPAIEAFEQRRVDMKPHDRTPHDDRTFSIVFLPGDGVGPEVAAAARRVLETAADSFGYDFKFSEALIGGAAIDATGDPLPRATVEACLRSDAVFLGAVGGPKWDGAERRPEEGLLGLRKAMGLYANLRPVAVPASVIERSPFKAEIVKGVDLLIVRELTGGAYFGEKTRNKDAATDLCIYTVPEIERVARAAFRAAQERNGHVTSVDKANVLETSRLWREVVSRVAREEFPDVELDHMLVDAAAMRLIQTPRAFDVILTENMFGDILSDEAAMLPGSIGLLGSASLGEAGPGVYEPIHGSAPDIAGMDKANPVGAIVSAAMLVRHSLRAPALADQVQHAVAQALNAGRGTADIGGQDSTSAFTAAVVEQLKKARWSSAHRPQMHWA